jgi:hypothetical protein
LISTGRLSLPSFSSLAPCFNSMLLGDTMAAVWVQKIARWDGFPSSQFGQINSPERKTLGTSIFLFKLPLKFSDRRRKLKRSNPGKNRGETLPAPLGRSDWAGRPTLFQGRSGPVSRVPPFFRFLSLWEKVGPVNLHEKLQNIEIKTIYRNPCLVFLPRPDVWALLPWWRHQCGEGAQRRVCSKP